MRQTMMWAGLLLIGLASGPLRAADSAASAGVAGLYELEPERVICVTAFGDRLVFTDFLRGTGGPLTWDGEQLVARRAGDARS